MCPIPFGHPGNNTVGLTSGKGIRLLWRVAVFDVGKGRQDGLQTNDAQTLKKPRRRGYHFGVDRAGMKCPLSGARALASRSWQ